MAQRAARVAPRAQGTLWEGSRRAASVWHPFARASSLQRRDPNGFPPRCSRPRESLPEASARAEAGARWSGDWGGSDGTPGRVWWPRANVTVGIGMQRPAVTM